MHDLFLSYRRFEDKRVAPLVSALKARGITVWQDIHEIEDFAGIQRAINDGLAHARALLVWYSKDYNASRACQWELTTAYCAAEASGGNACQRVLVVNPEPTPEHIKLPKLVDQLHLDARALSAEALADRIAARLRDLPLKPLGSLRRLARPAWIGSAGLGSTRFVGRLREMWEMHAKLQADQTAMLTSGTGRLQVRGSGGMGKSLLAEEYALRFGAAYPGGVFWLRAFGYSDSDREMDPALREAQRDSQMRTIAMELGLNPHGLETPQVRGLLRRHFQGIGQPFLWIVDDLPPIERTDALAPWLAPHALGRTLITTRSRHINHIEEIELPQLDADEALRLLARGKDLSAEDEAAARAICEELGGHALAVDVTAPLAHDIGFSEVLDMLRQPDEDALEFAAELDELLPVDHQRSVAATFLASIKRLGEPARDLLRLASVLASAPIPKQLQSGALGLVDQASDSAALKTAIRGRDQLIKSSLAENASEGAITVHTLVVRTIRFHDGRPERVEALRGAAVEVLLTKMPQVADIRLHQALADWVAHARHAGARPHDDLTADLLGWVGRHDQEQGKYGLAHAAFTLEIEARRHLHGKDHPSSLAAMLNLAVTLFAQGNLRDARQIEEQVLATRMRDLGEDHPDTLAAMNNLAQTLREQNDLCGARYWVEQVLTKSQRVLGNEHGTTLKATNNFGQILYDQNDPNALYWAEQVVTTSQRVLGESNLDTLKAMGNLASLIQDRKRSQQLKEQVLEGRRRILSERHPDITIAAWNLIVTLDAMWKFKAAQQVFDRDLSWLLTQDPCQLGAAEQNIAKKIRLRSLHRPFGTVTQKIKKIVRRMMGHAGQR